jgi:PAS domain S-box-containing protein
LQRKISDDIITLQVKFFTIGRFDMNKELQNPAAIDFMKVCENLHDGIHVSDGEGRILYVNKGYTRTTGIEAKDIIGRTVAEIEKEGKLYKGSVTERVLQTRERVDSVATIFKLDKEVLVTGIPIFDDDGNICYVVTNTRDFPELKNLESQLSNMAEEQRKTNQELAYFRRHQTGDRPLIYRSHAMEALMEMIRSVAQTEANILITGESGTGKELVANEIYLNSARYGKPFIKVNCAAIPAELLESELFGYEPGAFTGARSTGKDGLFEVANSGIIMLDEISDLPIPLQAKLLRVIQQRELIRVGGTRPIKLDIRIIAATNKDLAKEVEAGNFRKDLYYRLNVVPMEIMPLRNRREDIVALSEYFIKNFCKKYDKSLRFSPGGIDELVAYEWPGNVRELENMIERIVVVNPTGTVITREHVYSALNHSGMKPELEKLGGEKLKDLIAAYEKTIILSAIEHEGSMRKAAQVLGVDHSTLVKKCKTYAEKDA